VNFRTKNVLYMSALIFVSMMSLAAILVHLREREIISSMENEALSFATLTAGPLCEAYKSYYETGYFKFRQLVLSLLSLESELERVQIYSVDGKKLFDSYEFKGKLGKAEDENEEYLFERIRDLNHSFDGTHYKECFDMVYPYLEPWGWHRYSVRYLISKGYLEKRLSVLRRIVFSVTFISVVLGSVVSFFQTNVISKPLLKLTEAAREISKGNYHNKIEVLSKDEIGILAKALKEMQHTIRKDLNILESQKEVLSKANLELKKLSELKSQFLASISHELMTPLTSVKGYIEYIILGKLGPLTDGQKNGLLVAKRNLNRLETQIMDLLDFSSFETGKMEISLTPFHIKGAIREAVANLDLKLSEKEIKYEEFISSDISPVIADRAKIVQVLENLLTNAIKFTPQGSKISVVCNSLNGRGKPKIEVCVKDSGPGISLSMKGKIFEKFFQIDPRSKYKGIGLGLSIVKSILDAHKEKISLKSGKGKGSNFCFTLPVYEGKSS